MKNILSIQAFLIVTLLSFGLQSAPALAKEPNLRQVVDNYFKAFNKHDVDALVKFYSTDAVMEHPESSEHAKGHAAIREHIQQLFTMIPDVRDDVKNTVIQKDKAAIEFVSTGTAPSEQSGGKGKAFTMRAASIFEFKNGKIVRDATYYDTAATK